MSQKYELIRDVTPHECPWLNRVYQKGETVREFIGCTYGCVSNNGIAVSKDGKSPFRELPYEALKKIN